MTAGMVVGEGGGWDCRSPFLGTLFMACGPGDNKAKMQAFSRCGAGRAVLSCAGYPAATSRRGASEDGAPQSLDLLVSCGRIEDSQFH